MKAAEPLPELVSPEPADCPAAIAFERSQESAKGTVSEVWRRPRTRRARARRPDPREATGPMWGKREGAPVRPVESPQVGAPGFRYRQAGPTFLRHLWFHKRSQRGLVHGCNGALQVGAPFFSGPTTRQRKALAGPRAPRLSPFREVRGQRPLEGYGRLCGLSGASIDAPVVQVGGRGINPHPPPPAPGPRCTLGARARH